MIPNTSEGSAFVLSKIVAGLTRLPKIYCSRDTVTQLPAELLNGAKNRNVYKLWTAHYGAGDHICGPTTCQLAVQADGTQWIDHGTWDESLLANLFFAVPQWVTTNGGVPGPGTVTVHTGS